MLSIIDILHQSLKEDEITVNPMLDKSLAYALLRIVLGTNIAVHGISRLLAKAKSFAAGLVLAYPALLASRGYNAWSIDSLLDRGM